MAHDVFISYSSKDKSIAESVCSTLEAGNVRCWITPRDVLPGADWGESIIDAMAASRVLVLLLSANSNTSNHVKREVDRAVNKNLIVIPFRIEDVTLSKTLEYLVSTTHWMDALTPPLEKHVQSLAARIRQLLSISSRAPITVPSETAKKEGSPLDFTQRVTLTIEFTNRLLEVVASAGLHALFDGKDIGKVSSMHRTKLRGKFDLLDASKTVDLTVETTGGKHTLSFEGEPLVSFVWIGSYELDLPLGGNYHAVIDQSGEEKFFWLSSDKSGRRKPFAIKLVREPRSLLDLGND